MALKLAEALVMGFVLDNENIVSKAIDLVDAHDARPLVASTLNQFLTFAMSVAPCPGSDDEAVAARVARETRGEVRAADAARAIAFARHGGSVVDDHTGDLTVVLVLVAGLWFNSAGVTLDDRTNMVRAAREQIELIHQLHDLVAWV